jgi:hypothetical protein
MPCSKLGSWPCCVCVVPHTAGSQVGRQGSARKPPAPGSRKRPETFELECKVSAQRFEGRDKHAEAALEDVEIEMEVREGSTAVVGVESIAGTGDILGGKQDDYRRMVVDNRNPDTLLEAKNVANSRSSAGATPFWVTKSGDEGGWVIDRFGGGLSRTCSLHREESPRQTGGDGVVWEKQGGHFRMRSVMIGMMEQD